MKFASRRKKHMQRIIIIIISIITIILNTYAHDLYSTPYQNPDLVARINGSNLNEKQSDQRTLG